MHYILLIGVTYLLTECYFSHLTLGYLQMQQTTMKSNMVGYGSILEGDVSSNSHDLNTLIANDAMSPLNADYGFTFGHLGPGTANTWLPATESFATRDDVFIHYHGAHDTTSTGKLGLGYGGRPLTHRKPSFGPEVGFGFTLGDTDKNPIFLIKIAWGGKSSDFRPPR